MNAPAPKKSLGQHFLINQGVCRKIVDMLAPAPEDNLLEIGPGPGALTSFLLRAPHRRLLLIEKDDWWAEERQRAGGAEVLAMDALEFRWQELCPDGEWKLAGNLPYNIASPLIWDILADCRCWQRAVFMVQKEVGERICASPHSRAYGALSVWVQCHARAFLEFTVKPNSFRPPPKVESCVIRLEPVADPPLFPEALKRLLSLCFQQRRKQLGGVFRRAGQPVLEAALAELRIDPRLRPEDLDCAQFLALARFWAGSGDQKRFSPSA